MFNYSDVIGLSYMNVFIAGATITGLLKSQALYTQVNKLSQSPWTNFAIVFADKGQITKISAHFLKLIINLNSICNTGSPFYFQFHSSSS